MESKRLWLPNIPDVILVDNLIKKYNVDFNSSIISIIGEVDIPENQKQDILTYDLVNDGNCAIIGTDGLENEMILNSIVYSLVSHYNASQVNLYAFDFGTSNFRKYNKFPQFGGVVLTGEDEKYRNLFKLISDQINIRKKIVSDSGLSYGEYIKQNVGKMPLIVIFVNQYDSMNDYDDNLYDAMKDVYDYAYRVFFGKAPIDVMYRMNRGSKGAEQKVLQYIWDTYIEPKGDKNE